MEYAVNVTGEINDNQYMKHVGYSQHMCTSQCGESCMQKFYSQQNINQISCKITQLLMGVNKDNRPIIVPDSTITGIMSAVYENYRPETGDIYSRYNIPKSTPTNAILRMTDEVINIITTDVRNNLGMEECNSKLSIWTTVLGDFNSQGLRSHAPIKIRERRPQPLMFNMNY